MNLMTVPEDDGDKRIVNVLVRLSVDEAEDLDFLRQEHHPPKSRSASLREAFRIHVKWCRAVQLSYGHLRELVVWKTREISDTDRNGSVRTVTTKVG